MKTINMLGDDSQITRVLFVLGFRIPFPGAAWRRIEYFAKYLASKGMYVYIIGTITPTSILSKLKSLMYGESKYKVGSLSYAILNIQPYIGLKLWLISLFNVLTSILITLTILLLRPKIVVVSIPEIEQVFASYIGAKLVRAKFIADIRDPAEEHVLMNTKGLNRRFYELVKRLNFAIYREADAVTTVTGGLAKYLASHGVKAVLAPNGADTNFFKPYPDRQKIRKILGLNNSAKAIVFSGYLGAYYRIDNFLKALAKIVEENPFIKNRIRVVIVGGFSDSNYAKTFARMVRDLGIEELIVNLGVIKSPKRLAQILSACDIGLIPRVSDPIFDYAIPAKFSEYIACGLPVFVIARKGSELWNVVERYKLGYVCQPTDIECMAQTIKDIVIEGKLESSRINVLRMRKFVDRKRGAEALYIAIRSLMEEGRK